MQGPCLYCTLPRDTGIADPNDHRSSCSSCLTSHVHGSTFVLVAVLCAGDARYKVCVSLAPLESSDQTYSLAIVWTIAFALL